MKEQQPGSFSDFHFSSMNRIYWVFLFLLVACSSRLMTSSSFDLQKMQEKEPSMTLEKAIRGHNLYVQRCGSCHHLYEPARFTEKEWSSILTKMIPKAKVTNPVNQQLLTNYLKSLSK